MRSHFPANAIRIFFKNVLTIAWWWPRDVETCSCIDIKILFYLAVTCLFSLYSTTHNGICNFKIPNWRISSTFLRNVGICQTARCHIPEDRNLHSGRRESFNLTLHCWLQWKLHHSAPLSCETVLTPHFCLDFMRCRTSLSVAWHAASCSELLGLRVWPGHGLSLDFSRYGRDSLRHMTREGPLHSAQFSTHVVIGRNIVRLQSDCKSKTPVPKG
jgi:hypothetical protein